MTIRDRHTVVMDAQVRATAQTVMTQINRVTAGETPLLHAHSGCCCLCRLVHTRFPYHSATASRILADLVPILQFKHAEDTPRDDGVKEPENGGGGDRSKDAVVWIEHHDTQSLSGH